MVYFIVEAPYDKCFELFFKDELGYPNFYRMTELLPHEHASELILLTPSKPHEPTLAEALSEHAITVGVKHQRFGQGIQTGFRFHTDGMVQVQPEFKEALTSAVSKFIQTP